MNRNRTKKQVLTEQPEKQPLKLHYFYIRGQCQPIRNLLYYLDVDFEDVLHERSEQNFQEEFFNAGLPMLEDDGLKIHNAIAIMNYICRKYGKYDLIGLTPQGTAKIQEIVIKYESYKKRIIAGIIKIIDSVKQEQDIETIIQNGLKKLVTESKFIEYCLKNVSINKSYVFDSLSIIDFLFYQICYYIEGFFRNYIHNHYSFKYFIQFKIHFEKLKFFKKYKAKIEQHYVFFQFKNQQINKKIECFWKRDVKCLKKHSHQLKGQ